MADEKKLTALEMLRKFFNSIRRTERNERPPRFRDPRHRAKRVAIAKAWRENHNARAKQVAVCPHCREWFPTTEARNAQRAAKEATPMHRAAVSP